MAANQLAKSQPLAGRGEQPIKVALVAKPAGAMTGVGRYVQSLLAELQGRGLQVTRIAPALPPLPAVYGALKRLRIDLAAFLTTYPIWARYPPAQIYHFSSQNLASLLLFGRPPGRVVVTVHDIIPYLLRHSSALGSYRTPAERLFDRLAMAGLRRADLLVADSHYTRRTIIEQLGIAAEKIKVVYLGIDGERYRPLEAQPALLERYGLAAERRYLIYVGSEDPRKNLRVLLEGLARLRQGHPELELIKVGRAHYAAEREQLLQLARRLNIEGAIHFLDDVPETELPGLYNLAAVAVMPSLYEGFGFPLLEAMACGTPVVYCASSSLPELAGAAGLSFPPDDPGGAELAQRISALLSDRELSQQARTAGRKQAATFVWSRTGDEMQQLYGALLGGGAPGE